MLTCPCLCLCQRWPKQRLDIYTWHLQCSQRTTQPTRHTWRKHAREQCRSTEALSQSHPDLSTDREGHALTRARVSRSCRLAQWSPEATRSSEFPHQLGHSFVALCEHSRVCARMPACLLPHTTQWNRESCARPSHTRPASKRAIKELSSQKLRTKDLVAPTLAL